jgi:hypothetical protein
VANTNISQCSLLPTIDDEVLELLQRGIEKAQPDDRVLLLAFVENPGLLRSIARFLDEVIAGR